MFKFGSNSIKNRGGIDPKLIEIDDLAITLTLVDYGHPADAGLRLAERQYQLFLDEKSECDGYDNISNHQPAIDGYGKALDFYAFVGGKASWEQAHLAMVACAYFQAASILGYEIEWGGLWKSKSTKLVNGISYGWDMPHINLIERV
jgi:peptidoglycan L-alanyl-D-glutamate endopeptidase CwlK